ncbi:FxSxx-COOH protein [Nocardiopsis sp. EMB25]|uniref:FxSxx-COOH cyclophane-containing RiPP peptide n=1 Tax=Nocardiopsis TaxID=2013 RepID=UPI00034B3215|nr:MULTISPECIES: FxSxx-COOH cyclophane-containing RiPP peptide [Nocardiopsis]MCY9784162.1 FxSxx-COOH protein [Nocardiopsis sp. EMB25]
MPHEHVPGAAALVEADGLTLRDLDGYGDSAIVRALRSVLEPGSAASEAIAAFTSDPDEDG